MKIRFVGALGSVTGSCSLLNHYDRYYLVDCGSAQTGDTFDANEGSAFPFKPSHIRAVFLTHAHADHCGLLPLLVKEGFRGRIYCTRATADLTRTALLDVAAADNAGFSAPDVARLHFVCPDDGARFQFGTFFRVDQDLKCAFIRSSHVLGAVGFEFQFADWREALPNQRRTIAFSGDIGCNTEENPYQSLLNGQGYPSVNAEYFVCESTYGDRDRKPAYQDFWARMKILKDLLAKSMALGPGATIVFPCFALQRAQEVIVDLHYVLEVFLTNNERREWLGKHAPRVQRIADIWVDSPLAASYGGIFARELKRVGSTGKPFYANTALRSRLHTTGLDVDTTIASLLCPERSGTTGRNYSLSYRPQRASMEAAVQIVIAGAGMCNGGRVTAHLKKLLASPKAVIVLNGYQAAGTPGAELMRRAKSPTAPIDASFWGLGHNEVRAEIINLSPYYSGHADRAGLLRFILRTNTSHPSRAVKRVFLVHGENHSRAALKQAIMSRTTQQGIGGRVVEKVELPEPSSGWFDLLKNDWVAECHPTVDRTDMEVPALRAALRRSEEQLANFSTLLMKYQMAGMLQPAPLAEDADGQRTLCVS